MKIIILLVLICGYAFGQTVDYNRIVLPEHVQTSDFAEKLVQMAWRNHPSNEVFRRNVEIAGYEIKKSSASWADMFHAQGNLNEFNLNPDADVKNRVIVYPRYNVGVNFPLSTFIKVPYQVRQDRQRALVAQAQLNEQKLEVRNAVLKAYNEFVHREKVYKIQARVLSDMETSHRLIEQKFKNAETTFENYSLSQGNYNSASIALLAAERDYKNAKLDIEKLIGMKLEDVR